MLSKLLTINCLVSSLASCTEQESTPTESQIFDWIKNTWISEEKDQELVKLEQKNDWTIPKWAEGNFVSSLPSKFEQGDKNLTMIFDGFGRFNRFDIKDGQVSFMSKMMDTKWLAQSKAENTILPGLIFSETEPPRARSKIPGMNMFYQSKYDDNNWVTMERMADGETYVTTTDTYNKLIMDPKTLTTHGYTTWTDDLPCMIGVSHSATMPDGTVYSICPSKGKHMTQNYISVFKMEPSDPFKRIEIAQIKTDIMVYEHAFAYTEDYLVIFEGTTSFSVEKMVAGQDMLHCMENNPDRTSKFHAVKISDGTVTSFETGAWSFMIHFGNAYQPDKDTISFTAPGYFSPTPSPFAAFLTSELNDIEKFKNRKYDSRYSRFTLNLKDKTMKQDDLIKYEFGSGDVPTYNPLYRFKKTRYSYLLDTFTMNTLDENYAWPISKYDEVEKKVVASWGKMVFAQEPRFIPNPNGTEEDDGLIIVLGRNFKYSSSSLYFIHAQNMTTAGEFAVPIGLPVGIHNSFWSDMKIPQQDWEFIQ